MEIARLRGTIANERIRIGSNSYEKVKTFKSLDSLVTNQNSIQEEIKCRLKAANSCLVFLIPSKNVKIKVLSLGENFST